MKANFFKNRGVFCRSPIIYFIFRTVKDAREIDFLIIGQGLAGSAVAMHALARDYRIMVFDQPVANRSSAVAAGLFNPITGRKTLKTWMADAIFPALHQYYREAEQKTGKRFFYPMPMYRPFSTVEEQNEWMGKSAEGRFSGYISSVTPSPSFGEEVNDPFGGMVLRQTGYIDTKAYLGAVREYLRARSAYEEGVFDFDKLTPGTDSVQYGPVSAKKVIFCQGVENASNPWFRNLPVKSLKGEFVTLQCGWKNDVILNRGVYLVPGTHAGEWRAGATYNRDDHSPEISAWARREITSGLDDLIRLPYTVTGQYWGLRPTTPDRRPILGSHLEYDALIIFNGLGAKGVSLAPYFSEVLIRWLEKKGTIHREADVSRFN